MRKFVNVCWVVALVLTGCGTAGAEPAGVGATEAVPAAAKEHVSLFDAAKYMRVSEVHAGMKGYGLTVFKGTGIEKFNVEVVDVVHNFNPKSDVVLITSDDPTLLHSGPIEGMSGSPIYLFDETGKARMVGAFAYGWSMEKDPIAGVQPIQYMLDLPENGGKQAASSGAGSGRWSLADLMVEQKEQEKPLDVAVDGREVRLVPLETPLMAGGMSADCVLKVAPLFAKSGLMMMQAGEGGGSATEPSATTIEPGSVLGVPLLTGDAEMSAIGTCTAVVGDRVFAFGHPFNGDGPIELPMAGGTISSVIPCLSSSFKLGMVGAPVGTLTTDQSVGVSGILGRVAPMVPVEVRVVYDDGSLDKTYHFKAAVHEKLTPAIVATALMTAMTADRELPMHHTVRYDLMVDFANGQQVEMSNSSVNVDANAMAMEFALPMMAAGENPFQHVSVRGVSGTVHVSTDVSAAQVLSVMVPRSKFRPGETMEAYVSYQAYHSEPAVLKVEMDLPKDLPDGMYQVVVSDAQRYMEDERTADPFKYTAQNIDELFKVVRAVMGVQREAMYVRLVRTTTSSPDGISVGQVAMGKMPSSRRLLLVDSRRSDILPYLTSMVKVVPTGLVMSGAADFSITIDRKLKEDQP